MLVVGPQTERISQVKKELMHAFQMQDMGAATYFLGVRIVRNRAERSITLIQDAYIEKILTKYGMQDAKPTSTPMQLGALNLMVINPNQATKGDIEEYQSKMGSITYLAIQTRSDIAFECSVLSGFLTNPSQNHMNAANWLLRYIKGTQELGVQYGGKALANNTGTLHGYSASDFAGDSEGPLSLAENPEFHQRTKHIGVKYHYIREERAKGLIKLWYCPTRDMKADGLTKALGGGGVLNIRGLYTN